MAVEHVEHTSTFKKCCKKCGVAQAVIESLEKSLYGFGFQTTQRTQRIFITDGGTAEVWDIRVGNPNRGKGRSGGYRVIMFFIRAEATAYLDYINDKDEITKKHAKAEYEANIVELIRMLTANYPREAL